MFIFNLTYIKPLTVVERVLSAHIAYLDEHYADQSFLCSGPKEPRTGGVILCNCPSREEAEEIMKQDPFYYTYFSISRSTRTRIKLSLEQGIFASRNNSLIWATVNSNMITPPLYINIT